MEEAQLGISTTPSQSQIPMGFPPYRRSHLRSQTYRTLVRILSHCYDDSHLSGSIQPHIATQDLKTPDNGSGRWRQEEQEKESECFESVGSDFVSPMDHVPQKETQVHETIEVVEDKGREISASKMVLDDIELMMKVEEVEDSSRRRVESMSMQANGFDREQRLMDELELIMKGTENIVCDSGLIPLNSRLDEKRIGGSEIELMDYQVEHVEFQHSDKDKSENVSDLEVQGELNQHELEGFNSSSTSTATKGQTSASVISTLSVEDERQQKETELVKSVCDAVGFPPITGEGEFEKEVQCSQRVSEAMHFSLDQDMNSEALNVCKDGGLLDASISEDKHEMQNEEEKSEKSICANDATNSSNCLIENEDMEEGEISDDFGMDNSSFDMCSPDASILEQKKVDEGGGFESNSFIVSAFQDANNSGKVEPRTSDKNGIACGVEVSISQGTIKCDQACESGSVLKPGNSKGRHTGNKVFTDSVTDLSHNQVLHRGFFEVANKDQENSSAVNQKVDVSSKKKRGPVSEAKKAKKKQKKRKKRAEKNRQLGVKRLKLHPVQKPKTITYCRHYLKGRCHEGDKCQFSHDTVPLTKSKPCCHFARHSCMKGDDCPFDHHLSKYPCSNFVSKGSCSRGDACMFSHQVPSKQDIPLASNSSGAELKLPLQSGDTKFSMPLNNRDCSSFLKNHFFNSTRNHSHINKEHEVTDTVQKQPTSTPKGISFINVAKPSLLSPSTPKQGMVPSNKGSLVQIGTHADQSACSSAQNLVETPKKLPALAPKGINFLSFGKGPVSGFKSSISSLFNRENDIKLPQSDIFGLPEQASSSLNKDDYGKVGDGTKRSVPQTALLSNEILDKNQSVSKGMDSNFPGKSSKDDSTTDLQCSLRSQGDQSHSKSVQEGVKASDNCQTSTVTSSMLPVCPFVLHQSSELLASKYHKHASNSSQRALSSTLAFAAEHESGIKMK